MAGCISVFTTGSLALYSQVGTLCKKIDIKSDRHFEKHQFKIKATAQGILHPKGTNTKTSNVVTAEVVCGPLSTSLSLSHIHPYIAN